MAPFVQETVVLILQGEGSNVNHPSIKEEHRAFVSGVRELRPRARQHMEDGAVTCAEIITSGPEADAMAFAAPKFDQMRSN